MSELSGTCRLIAALEMLTERGPENIVHRQKIFATLLGNLTWRVTQASTQCRSAKRKCSLHPGLLGLYLKKVSTCGELMRIVRVCVKSASVKLKTVTTANAAPIEHVQFPDGLYEREHLRGEISVITDCVRWENVSFRNFLPTLGKQGDMPSVAVKLGQMDLNSYRDSRTALLNMLDAECGVYPSEVRVRGREAVSKALASANPSRLTCVGCVWEELQKVNSAEVKKRKRNNDSEKTNPETDFMTMRPLYLMCLLWALEKDGQKSTWPVTG